MREKPTILNRQTIAKTRIFHVEQLELRFANGVETQYERLVGSPQGSVLIVPMLDDNTVLLIREYAAGIDRYELALPKGRIEHGEELLSAANREIMEEVGYASNQLHHLTSVTMAPGYSCSYTHVVLARDLYPCTAEGDEPEPIDVVPWKLDELPQLVQRDDCTEARSIAALYMTREYLASV
jgi:ADP-ribose diphosphatase